MAANHDERAIRGDREISELTPAGCPAGLVYPWNGPAAKYRRRGADIELEDRLASFTSNLFCVVQHEQFVTVRVGFDGSNELAKRYGISQIEVEGGVEQTGVVINSSKADDRLIRDGLEVAAQVQVTANVLKRVHNR